MIVLLVINKRTRRMSIKDFTVLAKLGNSLGNKRRGSLLFGVQGRAARQWQVVCLKEGEVG